MSTVLCIGSLHAQRLRTGPQVLTFFSDVDDSEQPYCLYLPEDFDETKTYPLVVMLHGAGSNHRLAMRRVFGKSNFEGENDVEASLYFPEWKETDMIVAAPYARGTMGYQGFAEKDVMDMITDVKKRFNIDPNRMYLTGLSMGGGGTLWIGLSYPDMWAAIAPVCPAPPRGTLELAPNAEHLAVKFVHGDQDPAVPVKVSREWVAKLKELNTKHVEYEEQPGVDHFSWVQGYANGRIFDWFRQYERNPHPVHVRHATFDLKHGKSYWVQIDQKVPHDAVIIDARFAESNTIKISTTGVLAFTLALKSHPFLQQEMPLHVSIDGTELEVKADAEGDVSFSRNAINSAWTASAYQPAGLHKEANLEGPVISAFDTRHVYVYGTADSPDEKTLQERLHIALEAAEWSAYRGEFLGRVKFFPRVIRDVDVRPSDYASANLILFGTAETNRVIAGMQDKLPLLLKEKAAKKYSLTYVFPTDEEHLVVICSGLPWWMMEEDTETRFQPKAQTVLGKLDDYTLFSKNRKTLIQGYFDENWKLSDAQLSELRATKAIE